MARSARITAVLLLCSFGAAPQAPVRPSFEVASVKLNKSADQGYSNFPLGPGDVYSSNGGRFTARDLPFVSYLFFAYKITGDQSEAVVSQLPGWATMDRFDIEAKTDGDPAKDTKDQMRLMVQSLLAERFGLVARYETKQVPVFALTLAKPGKTGPQLFASDCSACHKGPGGLARVGNNRHRHLARKRAEDASRERGAFASMLDKYRVEFKLHFLPPSISMIRAIAGRL